MTKSKCFASQHYLSRDALAPGWRSSKKINKFWKWLKLAKTIRFGFIVLFYIWEPWDVCWFSSDFHKMSIANHLLTKWNWMLWLVTDLRKTSWNSFIRVLKHHAIGSAAGKDSNIVDKTIGYKNHFFPIGHHICSKHMTAFQSLLFILNARYSSFHMFFKPPSLLAAYNLKISDQAILGRTSTWTYTTIHTTTTYGSTDFTSP